MNIQEYINSGIIEQYVLGDVSAQERQEVECMSHIYPEIQQELFSQQQVIERLAMAFQVEPPVDLRAKILGRLKEQNNSIETEAQIVEVIPDPIEDQVKVVETRKDNIIKMSEAPPKSNFIKYLAAASVVFCIALAGLNLKNSSDYKEELNKMSVSNSGLEDQMHTMTQKMTIMQDPSFQKIAMPGIKEKSPESVATVYWNKKESIVYLNPNSLPKPQDGKQFQLWAIKDGVPMDMGMLPNNFDSNSFVKMTNIDNAQAFAITMEKEGGVPSPTMSEMYVMAAL